MKDILYALGLILLGVSCVFGLIICSSISSDLATTIKISKEIERDDHGQIHFKGLDFRDIIRFKKGVLTYNMSIINNRIYYDIVTTGCKTREDVIEKIVSVYNIELIENLDYVIYFSDNEIWKAQLIEIVSVLLTIACMITLAILLIILARSIYSI